MSYPFSRVAVRGMNINYYRYAAVFVKVAVHNQHHQPMKLLQLGLFTFFYFSTPKKEV